MEALKGEISGDVALREYALGDLLDYSLVNQLPSLTRSDAPIFYILIFRKGGVIESQLRRYLETRLGFEFALNPRDERLNED